jgi:ribonuclease HI
MPLDPRAIHIFTDGSCLRNPGGKGGAAAFVGYPDHLNLPTEQIVDFGCPETTNNRMELMACMKALEWLRKNRLCRSVTRAELVTDSTYVRDGLSLAIGWQSNGWCNVHGEEKRNIDLWKQLLGARSKAGMPVTFRQQLGKSTPILKLVDKAAKAAAHRGGIDRDIGFRRGKVSRSKVDGAAKIFPVSGQTAVIYVYRKDGTSEEFQIRFHLFDEAAKTHVGSFYAYASNLLTLELHRQHSYRVTFNNDPHKPVIEEIVEEVQLSLVK